MKQIIDPNDFLIVSKAHYRDLQHKVEQGFEYAMSKDNQIEELNEIITTMQGELEEYKTFFENLQKLLDKHPHTMI